MRKKQRYNETGEGETCCTGFRLMRSVSGMSLVRATPRTGRLHQIRATLYNLGYPVVGDKLYGVDEQLFLRFIDGQLSEDDYLRLRLSHQALHAWKLPFVPPDGEHVTIEAPIPGDFEELG